MLIVIDGCYDNTSSVLIYSLSHELKSRGYDVLSTAWTSHNLVQPIIDQLDKSGSLSNATLYFLMQLTNFTFWHEHIIQPALRGGKVVIADRYVCTGMLLGLARGVPEEYVRNAYSFVAQPDVMIWLERSVEEYLNQSVAGANVAWYDIGFSQIPSSSPFLDLKDYKAFLARSKLLYQQLATTSSDIVFDKSMAIEQMLEQVLLVVQSRV